MLRHKDTDSAFRWARTEMKKEMVMASSSYARIAGLQSEVGRVVVTRVAGSEVDYKRQISMYRKDMTVSVNNIRREQIKMRRKIGKYVKKLKQTRIENVKRVEEERRRDDERALLEALHLRLKAEAAAARVRRYSREGKDSDTGSSSVDSGIHVDEPISPSHVQFKEGPVYFETTQQGKIIGTDEKDLEAKSETGKPNRSGANKETRSYATVLPMINEDLEKEKEEEQSNEISDVDKTETQTNDLLNADEIRTTDDDLSVSSFGRKRPKKKEISFSDIIKLKYRSTQQLFDLVHVLAKRHGIPDIEDKVPDPRDNIVHRGATDDSFRLQASVLYPMKYGYVIDKGNENEADDNLQLFPPVNVTSPSGSSEEDQSQSTKLEGRKLSLEERRQLFLSGKYSVSVENSSGTSSQQSNIDDYQPKLKTKDNSLPLLVEKVNKVKLNQRAMSDSDNTYRLLSPPKPSSSRSSRSLPPLPRSDGSSSVRDPSVTWTEAFGLIRAIRSLENVS